MAKNANLVAVKVLNSGGSGTMAGVIQGVNWAHSAGSEDTAGSVASMSLGGGRSPALNDAVDAAATDPDHPLIVVVAAGNNNQNAQNFSPASAPAAVTIAAADNMDRKATFSNWGPLCTCWAPGVGVTSAWIGNDDADNTISGTSMACPHVSGQVAKFLQGNPRAGVAEVKAWLKSTATAGIITNGAIGGTPNLNLFADCETMLRSNSTATHLEKRY